MYTELAPPNTCQPKKRFEYQITWVQQGVMSKLIRCMLYEQCYLYASCFTVRMAGFNQCPFGTTSSRTIPLTKKDESQMPGPAYYQDVRPKTNDRLSHTFASTTSRLYSPPAVCLTTSRLCTRRDDKMFIIHTGFPCTWLI